MSWSWDDGEDVVEDLSDGLSNAQLNPGYTTHFIAVTPLYHHRRKLSRRITTDIRDPKYHKPFRYGWKREFVYRATMHCKKVQADVYYVTPSGSRLRSMREVVLHLQKTGDTELTEHNFTFANVPLGLHNSKLEIIRTAKKKSKNGNNVSDSVRNVSDLCKFDDFIDNPLQSEPVIECLPQGELVTPHSASVEYNEQTDNTTLNSGVEMVQNILNNISSIKKPAITKKIKCFRGVTDPELHKPFILGWQREVVYYYYASSNKKKKTVHTCYICPSGKRIRSMKELQIYLKNTKSQLNISNFTFCNGPLGINSKKEIVRNVYSRKKTKSKKVIRQQKVRQWKEKKVIDDSVLKYPIGSVRADDLKFIEPLAICSVRMDDEHLNKVPSIEVTTNEKPEKQRVIVPKQPKRVVQINDPIYRVPFQYGWKREVVYRRFKPSNHYPHADIYYHAPITQKKMRSFVDVATYLKQIECDYLTLDNFTFYRKPLGINDCQKEIIREAQLSHKHRKTV